MLGKNAEKELEKMFSWKVGIITDFFSECWEISKVYV